MGGIKASIIRTFSRLGTCGVFGIAVNELAEEIENLAVVTADLCFYSGLDRFRSAHPEMFYNVGIAEQNLVGVAGGLAKEGFNTFATTYASFAASRALDQVRVNMGYMKLPIRLIGLTSGFSVGILGATHISIEDIAIMRAIPNMVVLSPADGLETYKAVKAAAKCNAPVYLRLTGTMSHPIVYKEDYEYTIGQAITLREQGDVAIIATGTMVYQALKAADELETRGIHCRVIDMHTIKPLDKECLKNLSAEIGFIVTVEEHSVYGGLGSSVAEYLSAQIKRPPHLILGIKDEFPHAASYDYLLEKYRLTSKHIAEQIYRFGEKLYGDNFIKLERNQ